MLARSNALEDAKKNSKAPVCLYQELEPPFTILREYGGVDLQSVVVDDRELYQKLLEFAKKNMHDLADLIEYYDETETLFGSSLWQSSEKLCIQFSGSPMIPSSGSLLGCW